MDFINNSLLCITEIISNVVAMTTAFVLKQFPTASATATVKAAWPVYLI